jgi:hypothetical protein
MLEDKAYGHVVTFNPNGRPQVTMVWMDVEKPQNLQRDPRIIISIQNCTEPQSYLLSNGTATVTETVDQRLRRGSGDSVATNTSRSTGLRK